jgi:hypothetical protein
MSGILCEGPCPIRVALGRSESNLNCNQYRILGGSGGITALKSRFVDLEGARRSLKPETGPRAQIVSACGACGEAAAYGEMKRGVKFNPTNAPVTPENHMLTNFHFKNPQEFRIRGGDLEEI